MGSINVEVDVGLLELGNSVGNAFLVGGRSTGALLNAHVGDEISEGVGLEDDAEVELLSLPGVEFFGKRYKVLAIPLL